MMRFEPSYKLLWFELAGDKQIFVYPRAINGFDHRAEMLAAVAQDFSKFISGPTMKMRVHLGSHDLLRINFNPIIAQELARNRRMNIASVLLVSL